MNKKFANLLLSTLSVFSLASCGIDNSSNTGKDSAVEIEFVDYASQLKLDTTSPRKRINATLKQGVDGDTSHFYVDEPGVEDGVLKARYLGIDTPESTGKVEPFGKVASKFTTGKLSQENISIILESNDEKLNLDSTGSRYLIYVWYKTPDMADYKNLNLEIMQEGLAFAKNLDGLCYAEYFQNALSQGISNHLNCLDPNNIDSTYYYGDFIPVSVKDLRADPKEYEGKVVRFEGILTKYANNTGYVISYDKDADLYYGMQIFCGFNFAGEELMVPGNKLSICGTYQYYEAGDTYQVAGLTYFRMKPSHEKNLRLIEENCDYEPYEIFGKDLTDKTKVKLYGDITKAEALMHSYVTAKNLTVTKVYTTKKGTSEGAMTITCTDTNGDEITVRTLVLTKPDGTDFKEDEVKDKTITVLGTVDKYDGTYQIKVHAYKDIVIA